MAATLASMHSKTYYFIIISDENWHSCPPPTNVRAHPEGRIANYCIPLIAAGKRTAAFLSVPVVIRHGPDPAADAGDARRTWRGRRDGCRLSHAGHDREGSRVVLGPAEDAQAREGRRAHGGDGPHAGPVRRRLHNQLRRRV